MVTRIHTLFHGRIIAVVISEELSCFCNCYVCNAKQHLTCVMTRMFVYCCGAPFHPARISSSQSKYATRGFECNPAHTPGYRLEFPNEQLDERLLGASGIKLIQAVIGSVLFLAHDTRYDICYAVNQPTILVTF